jgi:hypothetical protein
VGLSAGERFGFATLRALRGLPISRYTKDLSCLPELLIFLGTRAIPFLQELR